VLASTNLLEPFTTIETGIPGRPPMNTFTDWFGGDLRFYRIGVDTPGGE